MAKTIFITGAATGIGRAAARLFARNGWFVGLYDIDAAGVEAVATELGASACHGALDVCDREAFRAAVAAFGEKTGGRMNVLLNNAGLLRFGFFDDISPESTEKMLDVNIYGVMNGLWAAMPMLRASDDPCVVNMCSASAIYGQPELAAYSASKFFVRGLTEALDVELSSKGIRVRDVMPGYVATNMVSSQTHTPGTLTTLGVHLTPEKVADVIWKAATSTPGGDPHFYTEASNAVLTRFGGLLPEVARLSVKKLAKM